MKGFRLVQRAAVALAALGMLMPNGASVASAADSASNARPTIKIARPGTAADVTLSEKGEFTGAVYDHNGKALEGAEVVVRQGDKVIAKSMTNDRGLFTVAHVEAGAYEVKSGNTEGLFQVWEQSTAPESAKDHALLVMGENGARGQFGAMGGGVIIIAAAVIASLIISAITLDRVNNIDDKVNLNNSRLDEISNSL